jgi:hypothetical protein
MTFFVALPIDVFVQITDELSMKDIIRLYSLNKELSAHFNTNSMLTNISIKKTGTVVSNFNEMLRLYNYKHITYNSPLYFDIAECFRRSASEPDLKYAKYYKSLGASNYGDFFITACQNSNMEAAILALEYLKESKQSLTYSIYKDAITFVTINENIEFLEYLVELSESQSVNSSNASFPFDIIFKVSVEYSCCSVLDWANKNHVNGEISDYVSPMIFRESSIRCFEHLFNQGCYASIPCSELLLRAVRSGSNLIFFKHIVRKFGKSCIDTINFLLIRRIAVNRRADLLQYLFEKKLYIPNQEVVDIIMLHALADSSENLIKLMITYGTTLYKAAFEYGLKNKNPDIINLLLENPQIYNTVTSDNYIIQLLRSDKSIDPYTILGHRILKSELLKTIVGVVDRNKVKLCLQEMNTSS